MNIVGKKTLRTLLQANRLPQEGVIEQISNRAIDEFANKLQEIAEFVAMEAMKGNYYRLSPIDIHRGFQKWNEKNLIGKLKLTLGE